MAASHEQELNELRARVATLEGELQRAKDSDPAHALEEVGHKLALALEATGLGLWSLDMETGAAVWDDRMRAIHDSPEAAPPHVYVERHVHPEDRPLMEAAVARTMASGVFESTDVRIIRRDGSIRWVMTLGRMLRDETGAIRKMVGGCLDVTRQHEVEAQLRGSQKMEALANVTAGVAHNFNNMLAVILPSVEFAAGLVPAPHQRMLEDATHAATRAAELVQQLLTYTGQSPGQKRQPLLVQKLVEAAVAISRPAFPPEARIHVEHAPAAPRVSCNPGQIEQVLVNLLLNARDALAELHGEHGKVTVTTRVVPGDDGREHVQISISDDGIGLSAEARAHLFEPFFTTKAVGKGTGLGLATSFAIVRDHGGQLSCPVLLTRGTELVVSLPRSHEPEVTTSPFVAAIPRGTSVLVVDDDDAVRDTIAKLLRTSGLEVLEANSGQHALEMLQQHPDVNVVLLDRTMPGGSGERFIPHIRERAKRAHIVFLSGRGVDPELSSLVDAVVLKPARSAQLLEIIHRLMSE